MIKRSGATAIERVSIMNADRIQVTTVESHNGPGVPINYWIGEYAISVGADVQTAALIAANLICNELPSRSKFVRDKLKIGFRKSLGRKLLWTGDIEDGVSHFLCPDHSTWLPNQRYDITLKKCQIQNQIAEDGAKDYMMVLTGTNRISPNRMRVAVLG